METTRRHLLFALAIGICLSVVLATPAFASYGFTGYLTWASVSGLPGQGSSPHEGFATTTQKCAVCHAVHGANALGEVLLRSDVAGACNYCHVNTASAPITQVYASDENNYSGTDLPNAHNSYFVLGVQRGVECATCHQVHAADTQMTSNEYLTTKLLKGSKTQDGTWDPVAGAAEPLASDPDTNTALTKWCARCHFTALGTSYPYYANDYNYPSHVMTAAAAAYDNPQTNYGGRVAWRDSTQCSSCHASGYTTSAWPHFTPGNRFLLTAADASAAPAAATATQEDGICLRCHRDNTGSGIGLTF